MNRLEKYFLKTSRSGFRQWCQDDISDAIGLWGDYEVTTCFDARGKFSHSDFNSKAATFCWLFLGNPLCPIDGLYFVHNVQS
jgi:hypothetical protein